LRITPPPGYQAPSTVDAGALPNAPSGASYLIDPSGSYGGGFVVSSTTGAVKLDVPLDKLQGVTGVVFDSKTGRPVPAAGVEIVAEGGAAKTVFASDGVTASPNRVTTSADGRYSFPVVPAGRYRLAVTRDGYTFASKVAAPELPTGFNVDASASYGNVFPISAGQGGLVIDLPIDSKVIGSALFTEKSAKRAVVEVGEFVDYEVRVQNVSGGDLADVVLNDVPAAGFGFEKASTRLNGAKVADPTRAPGGGMQFRIGTMLAAQTVTVTYRMHVGVAALRGNGINNAVAASGLLASNVAQAKVQIQGGVFTDRGYVIGKIYVDCDRNGVQDKGELGIPGVRLFLEDGTYVISDSEGKYSFYGVTPRTHALKLDKTTLPLGAKLEILGNRNSGDPGSRFVDLKYGELHKADFAEGSCSPAVLDDVKARREKAERLAHETERGLKTELTVDGTPTPVADVRARNASGIIGETNQPSQNPVGFTPLAPQNHFADGNPALPKAPVARVPLSNRVAVDELVKTADNSLGFLGLKDNDTLPYAQSTVRVKGPIGAKFELQANGVKVSEGRIAQRAEYADKNLLIWEYIGVDLKSGKNTLTVSMTDPFGNVRGSESITLIAPDQLGKLKVIVPSKGAAADGVTPVKIRVELSDSAGVPVSAPTQVTLEASLGRFDAVDLNEVEPGLQVSVEGGSGEFLLLPPREPAEGKVRASAGVVKGEAKIDFLPELRDMIAVGVVEGVINLRNINTHALVPAREQDGFEQELMAFSREFDGDKRNAAARAAFFLKGKIKGEYLLTAAYDSEKDTKEQLFRDIHPDEFYPVYGDSAVKGFDAQSTSKFYVRVDQQKSYLLYGDYATAAATDARKLANYSRSLTGVKEHYETGSVAVNAFASRDSARQVSLEIPANGTSGPYDVDLAKGTPIGNSEKVEIIVRDRNQPGVVLRTSPQTRFADYEFEVFTGRILFRGPVASLDESLNPIFIRVVYEVEGGEQHWIGGVDAQVKVNDRLEVGASFVRDDAPADVNAPQDQVKELAGVSATFKIGEKTTLVGEIAQSENALGDTGLGQRVELKHQGDKLEAQAYRGRTDEEFVNPNANLSKGRQEAGVKAAYRFNGYTTVKAEAIHTKDGANGGARDGQLVTIERRLDNGVRAEVGVRHSVETAVPAQAASAGTTPNEYTSVRGKLTVPVPGLKNANAYGEYEQAIDDSEKKLAAVGGEMQIFNRAKVYARHEFISSLSGPFALNDTQRQNTTVFGVDTDYMKDGHLFSEYRMRDAIAGREAEAAMGVRNKWPVRPGLSFNTSVERIHAVSGNTNNETLALAGGVEYTANPNWKGTARAEQRFGETSDSTLSTLGLAIKLSDEWTFLGKNIYSLTENKGTGTGERMQDRLQLGFAMRDTDRNVWNGLFRVEHKYEKDTANAAAQVRRVVDVFSAHGNYQAGKNLLVSGRVASKVAEDKSDGLDSKFSAHLASARMTYDIAKRWDIGGNFSTYIQPGKEARQYGAGVEVGYLVTDNLWLSGGYNFLGFRDEDLSGGDYTNKGAFVRLRFKFDEDLFRNTAQSREAAKPSS
jgi:large repetitive protein